MARPGPVLVPPFGPGQEAGGGGLSQRWPKVPVERVPPFPAASGGLGDGGDRGCPVRLRAASGAQRERQPWSFNNRLFWKSAKEEFWLLLIQSQRNQNMSSSVRVTLGEEAKSPERPMGAGRVPGV